MQQGDILHIYNRGNQKQNLFYTDQNYEYFIEKMKIHITPYCDLLAWCLMPNHFHLLVHLNERSVEPIQSGSLTLTTLSNQMRLMQSSYAQAINKQQGYSGSLFQQKVRMKPVQSPTYQITCFQYIHYNPVKAKLVNQPGEWPYSSYNQFHFEQNGLCDLTLADQLLEWRFNGIILKTDPESKFFEAIF